jgi:hypothetical protein
MGFFDRWKNVHAAVERLRVATSWIWWWS